MKARDNPFTTNRIHRIRYRLYGMTWEELLERLRELNHRAALVGPEGSGKTTLLEDLEPRLCEQGFTIKHLRLDRTGRIFPRSFLEPFLASLTRRDVILFDGADLMNRPAWLWLKWQTKKAGGLVITSHRNELLPTLVKCETSLDLLDEIVNELLGEESATMRDLTQQLYLRHQGNLRNVLRELYDFYAAKSG